MTSFSRIISAAALAATMGTAAQVGAQSAAPKIIYVSPEALGANEYLKLPKVGVEAAAKTAKVTARTYESVDPATRAQNLKAAAMAGASIVVSMGFEFNDILPDVAAAYPNTRFLAVDYCPATPGANVYCLLFKEQEMAFLAGAEAAWTTRTGKVGAIGGVSAPLLQRYTDGFAQGALYANPKLKVATPLWVGGPNPFSDPARGQQLASLMMSDRNDRVLVAAGATSAGVIRAAKSFKNVQVIGADINYCPTGPGLVMDNVVKRIDLAVILSVDRLLQNTLKQKTSYGLAEDAVTLTGLDADVKATGCTIADYPDVIVKLKQLRQKIIDGEVKVKDPMSR